MKHLPLLALGLVLSGLATSASAAPNCTLKLKSNDQMQFDLKTATVSASCATINIELAHTGKLPVTAMGHNVVVSKTPDVGGISKDAIKAGAAGGYLTQGDARVIAHTELVGGGGKTKVSFAGKKLTAGGDYTFFCSFPGHGTLMKGKLTVTK